MPEEKDKPLPEVIYGLWSDPETDDEYLRTDEKAETLVEPSKTVRVGVYKLTGYATVTNQTTIVPD